MINWPEFTASQKRHSNQWGEKSPKLSIPLARCGPHLIYPSLSGPSWPPQTITSRTFMQLYATKSPLVTTLIWDHHVWCQIPTSNLRHKLSSVVGNTQRFITKLYADVCQLPVKSLLWQYFRQYTWIHFGDFYVCVAQNFSGVWQWQTHSLVSDLVIPTCRWLSLFNPWSLVWLSSLTPCPLIVSVCVVCSR